MVVVPGATPVTTPDGLTVPKAGSVLLQVPPVAPSVNVVVAPGHVAVVPAMLPASGDGFMVAMVIAAVAPQLLVTI